MMEPQAQRPEHVSSFEGGDIAEIYHGGMPEPDVPEEVEEFYEAEFRDASYIQEKLDHLKQEGSDVDSDDSMEFDKAYEDKQCGDEDGPYEENFKLQLKRQRGGTHT